MISNTLVFWIHMGLISAPDPAILSVAMTECRNNPNPDRAIVRELLKIEAEAGIPDSVRGLTVAAACSESGIRPDPSGYQDGGKSRGMFQFMAWAKKRIRAHGAKTDDPRLDWRASARYWTKHVASQIRRVKRHCRGKGRYATRADYVWSSANTTAVRAPKCECLEYKYGNCWRRSVDARGRCMKKVPRCAKKGRLSETFHFRTLRRWREILNRREAKAAAKPGKSS